MPTLATFNVNNFFLRYKFSKAYPGDMSKKSLIEASDAVMMGYLPQKANDKYSPKNFIVWDPARRTLAATALNEPDGKLPDILCLQEVENLDTVRAFNENYLGAYYPYSLLIDGYDMRNIDVGVLSRFPIMDIKSHIDDTSKNDRIFSRDCLEVSILLPDGEMLTIFVNHLKSKLVQKETGDTEKEYYDRIKKSHAKRQLQAETVAALIEERFSGKHNSALYAVVGDFNDTPYSPYLKPLLASPRLTNVLHDYRGDDDSWTYYWRDKGRLSQIDFVLASKALAGRIADVVKKDKKKSPHIERGGLAYKTGTAGNILPATITHFEEDPVTKKPGMPAPEGLKVPFDFPRFQEVLDDWKNNISDHCPVKIWF